MDELLRKVEILERCAAECLLIARLAIDPDAQAENEELANEYQAIADRLRDSDLLPDT
jgi:hypothetical protein